MKIIYYIVCGIFALAAALQLVMFIAELVKASKTKDKIRLGMSGPIVGGALYMIYYVLMLIAGKDTAFALLTTGAAFVLMVMLRSLFVFFTPQGQINAAWFRNGCICPTEKMSYRFSHGKIIKYETVEMFVNGSAMPSVYCFGAKSTETLKMLTGYYPEHDNIIRR